MYILSENIKANYEFVKRVNVEEQGIEMVILYHKTTRAKVVLMVCDDKNRVFNIAFKTPVKNSKGTPHILEHSVLCGSRKYNVKDPFIELAKSSMNTFLNAMTFPDKTCYPVASANIKDFHNLMDVYLDAVFYPNAVVHDKIFRQEGWHYEIENRDDELKVNGVVLNEMRGAYSNPDDILENEILRSLFGGTNYEYDSGGTPSEIINLTFDEFKEFHKKYYSPSNAIIYFYGDLNYDNELLKLHNDYLSQFEYIDVDAKFIKTRKIERDKEVVAYYNIDTTDTMNKAYIAYNFVLGDKKSDLDKIILNIIDYVLFSSDSAILRNKFLENGFGESVYTFNEFGINEPFYSIISQNIDESKNDEFVKFLYDSLNDILDKGIDKEKLEAAINIIHFQYAEGEYGRMPKGLVLSLNSLDTYLYEDDPSTFLKYKDAFNYLKTIDLSDKNNIIYEMIKKIFFNNDHRTINVLIPKYAYSKEKDEDLRKELQERKKCFSDSELLECINSAHELKEYQSTKDSEVALRCIPSLKVSDLDKTGTYIKYIKEDDDIVMVYDNDREVIYMDLHFDVTNFTDDELYLLTIIHTVLSKIDLKDMSYVELDNFVAQNSGGLDIKFDVAERNVFFSYGIKIFNDKCNIGFDIIYKLIADAIFDDTDRIMMLVSEIKANDLVSIITAGHLAAITRAESSISTSSKALDKIMPTGIAKHLFINKFVNIYVENAKLINETFSLLYKKMYSQKRCFTASLNSKYRDEVLKLYNEFSGKIDTYISKEKFTRENEEKLSNNIIEIKKLIPFDDFAASVDKEAIIVPSDVNFVAIANTFDKNKYSGKLDLLKTIFNYEYLWTNIRVLGGAYGCMSFFKRRGTYLFTSYRDPNLKKTNDTFYGIYEYLKNSNLSYDTIEKYIIGSIGAYDNPLSVIDNYKKNVAAYFNDIDDSIIRKEREDLIHSEPNDIREIADIFKDIKLSKACAIIGEKHESEAKDIYDRVWKLTE